MRNRTEMVTTTLPGSDNEDASDLDDSEEDWKPVDKKVTFTLTYMKPISFSLLTHKCMNLNINIFVLMHYWAYKHLCHNSVKYFLFLFYSYSLDLLALLREKPL